MHRFGSALSCIQQIYDSFSMLRRFWGTSDNLKRTFLGISNAWMSLPVEKHRILAKLYSLVYRNTEIFPFQTLLIISTLLFANHRTLHWSSRQGSIYESTTLRCSTPAVGGVVNAVRMRVSFGPYSLLVISIFSTRSACEGDSSSLTTSIPSFERSPTISLLLWSTASSCQSFLPTNTPSGTTSRCCKYYVVQSGDTCNAVASRFEITFDELRALNPALNTECSNLLLAIAYLYRPTELELG